MIFYKNITRIEIHGKHYQNSQILSCIRIQYYTIVMVIIGISFTPGAEHSWWA